MINLMTDEFNRLHLWNGMILYYTLYAYTRQRYS